MTAPDRTIYSFIIDEGAVFFYQGWHLARSLLSHTSCAPEDIFVHVTAEAERSDLVAFEALGCRVKPISRFGDGRFCNRLNVLGNLTGEEYGRAVLLDTDMIVVSDVSRFLSTEAISAKIVDKVNPSLAALDEIARAAGIAGPFERCPVDGTTGDTYRSNCNGGFYCIPRPFAALLDAHWRRAATWLLANAEPLRRERKQSHVDQVSFWLAMQRTGLPFVEAPSNVNYFLHFAGVHHYFDPDQPLAILHYHRASLDSGGGIRPPIELNPTEQIAVDAANRQMSLHPLPKAEVDT
jgi:hypothetical protein